MLKAKEKFKNLLRKKAEKDKWNTKSYTKNQKIKTKLIKFLKSSLPKIKTENSFLLKNQNSEEILIKKIRPFFKIRNQKRKKKFKTYSLEKFDKLSTIGKYNNKLLNKSGNFIIKIKNKELNNSKFEYDLKKEKEFIFHEIKKQNNKFVFFKNIIFPPKIKKLSIKLNCDNSSFPIKIRLDPWYLKTTSEIILNEEKQFFKEFSSLNYIIEKDDFFVNSEIRFLNINILVMNSDKINISIKFHNPKILSDFYFNGKIFLENEKKFIDLIKKKKKENLNQTNYIKYNKRHMRNKSEKIMKINSFFLNDKKKIEKILKKKKILDKFNYYLKRINQYKLYIKLSNVF